MNKNIAGCSAAGEQGSKEKWNCSRSKVSGGGFKPFVGLVLMGLGGLISGCTTPLLESSPTSQTSACPVQPPPKPTLVQSPSNPCCVNALQPNEIKITAVGYGATSSYEGFTPGQKRLMAMRSSKLDAYRALAEQIQGVRVNGNSTVSSMMAQVDSFRVFVDAYLRGAQVVTVTPMNDGNYETTIELTLNSRFFDFANTLSQQVKNNHPLAAVGSNVRGAVGPGAAYNTNFYYSE